MIESNSYFLLALVCSPCEHPVCFCWLFAIIILITYNILYIYTYIPVLTSHDHIVVSTVLVLTLILPSALIIEAKEENTKQRIRLPLIDWSA